MRRAHITPGNPPRGTGCFARPVERSALLRGQGRVEPYQPHGAALLLRAPARLGGWAAQRQAGGDPTVARQPPG